VRLPIVVLILAVAVPALAEKPGQLVLVRAADWSSKQGTLRRYERAGAAWKPVGDEVPVSLGKNGIAWGIGLEPADPARQPTKGPRKREGDGRTPAGVFQLTEATGREKAPPPGTKLPYREAGELVCVDDAKSPHYNRIVPDGGDWASAEQMDLDVIYRLVINVGHNAAQVPGGGSCIFLHIWRKPGATTLGCTAMDGAAMETLMAWLDPARAPILVVLPEPAYAKLKKGWGLP